MRALNELMLVKIPNGLRWFAPVSLHVTAEPLCASLRPLRERTSNESQIVAGPSDVDPPRSSGNTKSTCTCRVAQRSACSRNRQLASISEFDCATLCCCERASLDAPSGSCRVLSGGWPVTVSSRSCFFKLKFFLFKSSLSILGNVRGDKSAYNDRPCCVTCARIHKLDMTSYFALSCSVSFGWLLVYLRRVCSVSQEPRWMPYCLAGSGFARSWSSASERTHRSHPSPWTRALPGSPTGILGACLGSHPGDAVASSSLCRTRRAV